MPKSYKWMLRKGSKKEICPQCGQRRFVPYVLTADGVTLAGPALGRCDREQNCGYQRYPDGVKKDPQPIDNYKPATQPIVFDSRIVKPRRSALFDFAYRLIGVDAYAVWERYKIDAIGKATIFWYFDANGLCRGGKEICYKADGHRDKSVFPPVCWAHKDTRFNGTYSGDTLLQPLFGEHLLNERPNGTVAIVESEKTAALMSAFEPNTIWLACGGSQGLKRADKLKVLKGRKVVLIPDNAQYYNWKNTAEANGWKIIDFIEKHPMFEGCDILDYYTL